MTTTAPTKSSKKPSGTPRTPQGKAGEFLDSRLVIAGPIRKQLNKVFPDHWSFMLGEIALYSFIVLLLTGTYLTFFFDASMADVVYNGSYIPLRGVTMSKAYESTLHISFDVRGGLVVRQIHHWAALMFVAAMLIHMLRVFFTGAFRKPREFNWIIGVLLLVLGVVEGFAGYSLPDDLLSGTGLRIADAIMLSTPVIGTWLSFLVFGGPFPGDAIIGRFYIAHVLLIPAILAALIGAHMALLIRQKHTEFPGPGKTEATVSGERVYPVYAAKAGGFFFIVAGAISALGGLVQINPIWLFGPYNPAQVSAGSQPDWYMAMLDGSTRLFPSWDIRLFGYTIPAIFWPTAVLPMILIGMAISYPFLEAKMTKDRAHHNLLQRPRDVPVRTSLGAMALTFCFVLFVSGGNDLIAKAFGISLNAMTWGGRIALIVLPPLAYTVSYVLCLGLQRHDREVLEHGIETGIIMRLPTGEFIEVHQPLGPVDDHGHGQLSYAGTPVPKRMNRIGAGSARHIRGFFFPVKEKPEIQAALDEAIAAESAHASVGAGESEELVAHVPAEIED
ncbi:menaquinol-cytochrome c reductase cytochrome b subunit precursor [Jatrophihabitans sp. GAS493]|uniref:cytochrome bc1 complex cytochrome b subunit n=1 Tax=Jatrophihabitans sp. GAS493 TaxID=1907575 RepID=UPI000BB6788E|nr:cytochrome bc complex cytochrome b subunit [Jatrophihabitans sp. GAS493]SOD74392.1 menaquinol-cytochrome c reductase cytochrome b subunit precursor [Jatrophihabitans sp. GAS493]